MFFLLKNCVWFSIIRYSTSDIKRVRRVFDLNLYKMVLFQNSMMGSLLNGLFLFNKLILIKQLQCKNYEHKASNIIPV